MRWRIILITLFVLISAAVIFVAAINRHVRVAAEGKKQTSMTEIRAEEPLRVAVVFGAGVWQNGEPSPVLYDRVLTAVELRRAGLAGKLLMSGDNRFENYNEPQTMKETAMKLGVPESEIVLDYAGRSTYDTCYRAREIFGVRRAILVSQEFHLNRAIYLCESLGVASVGITADRRNYGSSQTNNWAGREFFATLAAWFDLNVRKPVPILGDKEFITP